MPLGEILPQDIGPYLAMMVVGFVIGAIGHASRSRWLVGLGILLIFLGALLFPVALNLFAEHPEPPPGPTPTPY